MAAKATTDTVHDSRRWELPEYLEQVEGGVVLRPTRLSTAWTLSARGFRVLVGAMVMFVMVGVILPYGPLWFGGVVVALVVPVALPFAVLRMRRRGGVLRPRDVRLVAGIQLAAVAVLIAASLASVAWSAVREPAADVFSESGRYQLVPLFLVGPLAIMSWAAGLLLRVARRIDPATPAARLPRDRSLRPPWYTVDYGEAGPRFPGALALALALPVFGVGWLSMVVSDLVYGDLAHDLDDTAQWLALGCGFGLVPLIFGAAFWPWLPAALSRGLRPGQVRAVGWAHAIGGCVSGLGAAAALVAFARADPVAALPSVVAVLLAGGLLAGVGRQLITFGAALHRTGFRRAGSQPSAVDAPASG